MYLHTSLIKEQAMRVTAAKNYFFAAIMPSKRWPFMFFLLVNWNWWIFGIMLYRLAMSPGEGWDTYYGWGLSLTVAVLQCFCRPA